MVTAKFPEGVVLEEPHFLEAAISSPWRETYAEAVWAIWMAP
jgi:hypothetical protein